MPVNKIHSFFAVFIGSFTLLCFLVVLILFYNNRSEKVNSLAFESIALLSEWNSLENESNDLLLKRFTQFGTEVSPVIENWQQQYRNFEENLNSLISNPMIKQQPEIAGRLDGAYRVWRFTEIRLNNASHYFNQIINSGLGEKVMVNGMLHTMYQMRMEGQLSVNEICLLEETISALENLDNTTDEFDFLFSSIVYDMQSAGELNLRRTRQLFVALFSSAALVFALSFLINRQLKTAQQNRRLYITARKERLLRGLCRNSSEEELELFRKKQTEYGIALSIDKPVLIIMFQIDDFNRFSHQYNIEEQQEQVNLLCTDLSSLLASSGFYSEFLRYDDESIIFLFNADASDDLSGIEKIIRDWHSGMEQRHSFSVTVTMSDLCFDNLDLDHDFENLQRLSEYRYLLGRKAFIMPGSWLLVPDDDFRYPLQKARRFEEAFKSLNKPDAIALMTEMIEYAEPYGPESVRRLVIRLTASISSVVELLEKSYHASISTGVTPMILAIQKTETLTETRVMLAGIVENMIEACLNMKTEKHDQTVMMIKEIIENELADLNLSADQIAARFNLTTSYVNRLFKKHTTLSIAGYINECRLIKAEELIRTTTQTAAQIADQSGFASMGTFFRLFKKKYGRTPGEMASELAGS